jgi:hypothetical protein
MVVLALAHGTEEKDHLDLGNCHLTCPACGMGEEPVKSDGKTHESRNELF